MNPPFSVIFFTTLVGMGQGLFLAIISEQIREQINGVSHNPWFYVSSGFIVLALLIGGLILSFFHLGHPERAWRAATKWRTSWLSREVIVIPLLTGVVFVYTGLEFFPNYNLSLSCMGHAYPLSLLIGIFGIFALMLLFVCTGMIYASLRFLQQWHSPLTPLNFILMGCGSGFTLAATISSFEDLSSTGCFVLFAFIFTLFALVFRFASLIRNKKLRPKSTIQSALGINNSKINQISSGAMAPTFNRHQFSHNKTRFFIRSIKWIFIVMAFCIPLLLLAYQLFYSQALMMLVILIIQYVGLVAERWYFFADANHPQNLYYQVIA